LEAEQTKATKETDEALNILLNYCHSYPDAQIEFRASDMILWIHSDAAYLVEAYAHSRAAGYFFLGDEFNPKISSPSQMSLYILCVK